MKIFKTFIVILLLFLMMGVAAWLFMPGFFARQIMNDNAVLLPVEMKKNLKQKADILPEVIDSLQKTGVDISMDDLIAAIDRASVADITNAIDELNSTKITNEEKAIDIILKNLDLGKLENEKAVALLKQKITMRDINAGLKILNEVGEPYALTVPFFKKTLKTMLIEKKNQSIEDIRPEK